MGSLLRGIDRKLLYMLVVGAILLVLPSLIINVVSTTTVGDRIDTVMILKPGSAVDIRIVVPAAEAELFLGAASTTDNAVYSIRILDSNDIEYGNEIVTGSGNWRFLLGDPGQYRIIVYYPATAPGDLEVYLKGYVEYSTAIANTPSAYTYISISIIGALIAGYAAGLIASQRREAAQVQSNGESE